MVGGIVALWLTGAYLSVPASVGFIALLGIAVPYSMGNTGCATVRTLDGPGEP
jgi:Cu/Ag efflux pump CusA